MPSNNYSKKSDRETLPASTSSGRIGIFKIKSLSGKPSGKIKGSIKQVEKTFQVGDHLHSIILEDLIIWPVFIIKIHFIGQAGAAAAGHADPHEMIRTQVFFGHDFLDAFFCSIGNKNHPSEILGFGRFSGLFYQDAVFGLIIPDGGFDGVFGEH